MTYPLLKGCTTVKESDEGIWTLGMNVDSQKHLYLNDHCFGGKALVPYAVTKEVLFEAALYYFETTRDLKGLHPYGVDNLKLMRATGMAPGKRADIDIIIHSVEEITEGPVEGFRLLMSIRALRINKTGKVLGSRLIMKSAVLLRKEGGIPFKAPLFTHPASKTQKNPLDFRYFDFSQTQDDYYGYFYPHHGYLMQGLTGKFGISSDNRFILGEYTSGNKETDYVKGEKSVLFTSPLGLDCTFQYAVFISRLETLWGRLPVGADSIRIYKKHPANGLCGALIEVVSLDDEEMVGNITSFDESGEMILEAKGFVFNKAPFSSYDKEELENRLAGARNDESIVWSRLL